MLHWESVKSSSRGLDRDILPKVQDLGEPKKEIAGIEMIFTGLFTVLLSSLQIVISRDESKGQITASSAMLT